LRHIWQTSGFDGTLPRAVTHRATYNGAGDLQFSGLEFSDLLTLLREGLLDSRALPISAGRFPRLFRAAYRSLFFRTATEEKRFVPGEFGFGDFQSRQKETPHMIPQSREYPTPWGLDAGEDNGSAPLHVRFPVGMRVMSKSKPWRFDTKRSRRGIRPSRNQDFLRRVLVVF